MITSYENKKVRRVINKGTKIIEEDLKKPNWAGEDFHDHETKRVHLAGNLMVSSAKGTNKIQLGTIDRKRPAIPKGQIISTRKGTGLTKLR